MSRVPGPATWGVKHRKPGWAEFGRALVWCGGKRRLWVPGWLWASGAPLGCRARPPACAVADRMSWSAPLSGGPTLSCPYQAWKLFPREPRGWAGAMGSPRSLCRTLTTGKASRGAAAWSWAVRTCCPMACGSARAFAGARELPDFVLWLLQGGEWWVLGWNQDTGTSIFQQRWGNWVSTAILLFAFLISWRYLHGRGAVLVKADVVQLQRTSKLKSKVCPR